jgi:tetratricopeptide (TPR) repeat protein
MLMVGQAEQALVILEELPAGAGPPWQIEVMRGRAMILQGKWDQARAILPEAMKLSPDKVEAHYLLGLVYEHEKDYPRAAEQFKAAFESASPQLKMNGTAP